MQNSISDLIKGYVAGLTSRVLSPYFARITQGGGIYEAPQCVESALNSQSVLNNASFILIPSGYKGGTLYSELPINGNGDLTWTRGGDAFRTNASGLLQRVPWNLVQYSEQFSNAFWIKTNATISADATTAPNGTTTADLLYPSTSGSTRGIFTNAISIVNGTTYTWTIYAKASGKNWLYINCWVTVGGGAYFNLSTGVVGTVSSGVTASIENVGNGWYRCIATRTSSATASTGGAEYYVTDADNSLSVTASGTNGVFIWGAQLVEGTTAQTYLPTTDRLNFPRLSYMYGSCPSALLEPQRTNSLTNSLGGGTGYDTFGTLVITNNFATAPDGTTTATRVNASAGVWRYRANSITNLLPNTTYTFSLWVKSNTSGNQTFRMYLYNLLTSFSSDLTATTTWQRFTITFTSPSTVTQIHGLASDTANNSADILTWGWQIEQGAYATTYIPTTTATATRVADSFSRSNIYTNGLISASGGTWFVELRNNVTYTRDGGSVGLNLDASTLTNGFAIRNTGATDRLIIQKYVAGSGSTLYTTTTNTTKIAIKWNGTTADIFANGTKVISATSFTPTNMENLSLSSGQVPYFIQQMALFPTPLSDTDCATLTT